MKEINKIVEMIVSFENYKDKDTNKEKVKVKPIRFRLTTEEQEERVFQIERIVTQSEERIGGQSYLIYTCEILINEAKRNCMLKFCKNSCKWLLWKI